MAYALTNPPVLKTRGPLANTGSTWSYLSADVQATVAAANYFSNALALGMKPGDLVEVIVAATFVITLHRVTAVSASGATLSAGIAVT